MANFESPNDALLIVDVQPDFCPGGALPVENGDQVIPVLNQLIEKAQSNSIPVYASRDFHPPHHCSFQKQGGLWPPHCVQDTPGAAYHPELRLPPETYKISKGVRLDRDQYSAFDETGLTKHLQSLEINCLWIGGLAQDVCVRASVLDACQAGFQVKLITNATYPVDAEQGEKALEEMKQAGAELIEA